MHDQPWGVQVAGLARYCIVVLTMLLDTGCSSALADLEHVCQIGTGMAPVGGEH